MTDKREPTAAEAVASYNQVKCVFCGYKPDYNERLAVLIIHGFSCWCCLGCEVQTIGAEN